ncbi:hypothetical protein ACXPWS_19165 [Mycobacterium sp. BMJ-28]
MVDDESLRQSLDDDRGVTCRRWNWRQARRTQLNPDITTALFILDALAPMTDGQLTDAADELTKQLHRLGSDIRVERRVLSLNSSAQQGKSTC